MTKFLPADIPASITTVEQLAVWCAEVLQNLYPNTLVIEFLDEAGEPIDRRAIEAGLFFYTAAFPPEWRHSSRLSVTVAKDFQATGRIWDHVGILGDSPIPTGMRRVV